MSQKPSGVYELFTGVTRPDEFRVLEFALGEEICGPFRLDLSASCPISTAEDVANRLLGHPATFTFHGADIDSQARRGTIVEARVEGGLDQKLARLRISVVPRLGLMEMRINSRIFMDKTVPEILAAIFDEWQIEHEYHFIKAQAKRVYTTQYQESDLAFVTRLCAKEGLGFFLAHAPLDEKEMGQPNGEKVVVYDSPGFYPALAPGKNKLASSSLVHWNERFTQQEHSVSHFGLARSLRPEFVRLGDFDFRKPRLALRALAAVSKDDRSPIGDRLGGEKLSVYRHAERGELENDPKIPAEIDESIAKLRLSALRRDRDVGRGTSRSMRLYPGVKFTLEEHPAGSLNADYVVTRVDHKGRLPETESADERVYENAFECVPASVAYVPLVPAHRVVQSIETAIVVGAGGNDLHCDESGRVKVQFHWDLDGKSDDTSSCWLRVSQPWAGTNWGTQFVPRVGTEVLVGFLGGDVDRPVILGSLYNAVRPWPFKLPSEAKKSGFRTAPNGGSASELVFDDEKGKEKLSLKAQRDFLHTVENDYELNVKRSERVRVDGDRNHTVTGDASHSVMGDRIESIGQDLEMTVLGSHQLAVSGNSDLRVTGNRTTRIEGLEKVEYKKPVETKFVDDQVVRVTGHLVTVVGLHDARRSSTLHVEGSSNTYSTGSTEFVSEKEIVLRVGESSVRITPDGVEIAAKKVSVHADNIEADAKEQLQLFSKKQIAFVGQNIDAVADQKIVLKAQSGQIQLDQNARIDGTMLKLNCSPDPVDPLKPPDYTPPKVTKIKLADENGNAIPSRRYVIAMPDGSERSGITDDAGEADVYLDLKPSEKAKITFVDVDKARKS
jgi:type VI secretion system secreted protein VgrG